MNTPKKSNGAYFIELIKSIMASSKDNLDVNKMVNIYDDKRIILKSKKYKILVLWIPDLFDEETFKFKISKINRMDFEIHSTKTDNDVTPILNEVAFDINYITKNLLKYDYARTFEDYLIEQFENRLRENNQQRIIEILEEILLEVS